MCGGDGGGWWWFLGAKRVTWVIMICLLLVPLESNNVL